MSDRINRIIEFADTEIGQDFFKSLPALVKAINNNTKAVKQLLEQQTATAPTECCSKQSNKEENQDG